MSRLAAKAEREIDRVARILGCSEDGITWCKNALDPFPDIRRELVGHPDTVKTPATLQYYREQVDIKVPDGVTGAWDCLISHNGYEQGHQISLTNTDDSAVVLQKLAQAGNYPCGIVEVRAGEAGNVLLPNQLRHAIVPKVNFDLPHRIVAIATEVVNTTPDLYKSGGVITYRQPSVVRSDIRMLENAAQTILTPIRATQYNTPPESSSEALLLDGSLEWAAEEGTYTVGVLSEPTNEVKTIENRELDYQHQRATGETFAGNIADGTKSSSAAVNVARSSYDQFGSYFTNLHHESTLTCILHYIIERFPTLADTDLITMAKPSTAYDPASIELYTKLASKLPTGTMVKNNSIGAFLGAIGAMAKEALPVVGEVLGRGFSGYYGAKGGTTEKVVAALDAAHPINNILKDVPKLNNGPDLVSRLLKEKERNARLQAQNQIQKQNLKDINDIKNRQAQEQKQMRKVQMARQLNYSNPMAQRERLSVPPHYGSNNGIKNNTFISARHNGQQQRANDRAIMNW
jgi:hypothetical protein